LLALEFAADKDVVLKKHLFLMLLCLLCLPGLCAPTFAQQLVDINSANAVELAERLKGIGPAKASAIVKFRSIHGPFKVVDDLVNVKGIGIKTVEKLRDFVSLGSAQTSGSLINKTAEQERHTRLLVRKIMKSAEFSSANGAPSR
jgi:competence protein ComEA